MSFAEPPPGYFAPDGSLRLCTGCGSTPKYCTCDVPGFPRIDGMAWQPFEPGPGWELRPYSPNGHAPDADDLAALAGIAANFTPVDWHAAWDAKPDEIQWLIEPLIEAGQSVALYAVPGTGKSLIALECAAALAAGRPVLGNPARDPVTVLYIDVENRQPSLVERLQALGYKAADLDRLILYSFPSIAALDTFAGGQQVLALAITAGAAIVIIDTTSRVVAGKENDADTYLAFYRHSVIPLRARGIALLRLDHPGKDVTRGTRGSSAKKGDVDSEWLLSKTCRVHVRAGAAEGAREPRRRRRSALRAGSSRCATTSRPGSGNRAGELAADLDRLKVPADAGRGVAGKALRDAGIKATTADLAAAIRDRKLSVAIQFGEPLPGITGPVRDAADRSDSSDSVPLGPPGRRRHYRDGTGGQHQPGNPAKCKGDGCNATPRGGAEYCQACRLGMGRPETSDTGSRP